MVPRQLMLQLLLLGLALCQPQPGAEGIRSKDATAGLLSHLCCRAACGPQAGVLLQQA
jgi:hypothetical protein